MLGIRAYIFHIFILNEITKAVRIRGTARTKDLCVPASHVCSYLFAVRGMASYKPLLRDVLCTHLKAFGIVVIYLAMIPYPTRRRRSAELHSRCACRGDALTPGSRDPEVWPVQQLELSHNQP